MASKEGVKRTKDFDDVKSEDEFEESFDEDIFEGLGATSLD